MYATPTTRTPIRSTGKRGRQIEVELPRSRPASASSRPDDYTPQYHEARQYHAYIQNIYSKTPEDQLTANDRRQLATAADAVEQERRISELARQRGYTPGRMSRPEWSELADELRTQAAEDLHHASQQDREAAGEKLRGKADTWAQVGGEARLVRSGASRRQAREAVQNLNAKTAMAADDYMADKLADYGYNPATVDRLNYNQRRKLLAEIGHGERQKGNITGVTAAERDLVISRLSEARQREAREIAMNPRAAKGLETWSFAMIAAEKADRWDLDLPPEYIYERDTAPRYVTTSNPARPAKQQEPEYIDF
jgi:hypothetical protein